MEKDEQRDADEVKRRFTLWPNYFAALFGLAGVENAGLAHWPGSTAKNPSGAAARDSGLFEYLLALSRPYFSMAQRFASGDAENRDRELHGWLDNLTHAYAAAAQSTSAQAEWQIKQSLAFWEYGFAHWQQSIGALFPHHEAMQPGAPAPGAAPFPMMPGIGYSREMQEQYQELARRAVEYVAALQAYNAGIAGIGTHAVERLRAKVQAEPQEIAVDSLRKLYDMWVDACEEAYSAYAMSKEYAARYAQLVAAAAALRRQATVLIDAILEWLNMPTRREVDTLAQRLHETRQEMHALRAEIERIKESSRSAPGEPRANPTH